MHWFRLVARLARTVVLFAIGLLFVWTAINSPRGLPQNIGQLIGATLLGGFGVIVLYVELYHLRAWFRRQHDCGNRAGA